jgi:hypothetical protein
MPIKDLSETVRLPRLGKIHLGYKHPEKGYPVKTDYFVLPKDHSDYKKLVEIYGEKPKELRILIPVEDEEQWASQYYKAYSLSHGLVCKGDGETAMRMIDTKTGALPDRTTSTVLMKDMSCAGRDCPEYKAKKCSEVMNLRFILPEVPGLGVWQIDTGSINSILNVNSCAKIIKKAFGRISLIPLILALEPIEVNNPESGKKQTVYVMNLRSTVTMAQLADAAREQAKTFMLEAPDLESEYEMQLERDVETVFGDGEPKAKPEVKETTAAEDWDNLKPDHSAQEPQEAAPEVKAEGNLMDMDFKTVGDFYTACHKYFKLDRTATDKEVPEYKLSDAGQRKRAWQQIVGTYNRKEDS